MIEVQHKDIMETKVSRLEAKQRVIASGHTPVMSDGAN